MKAICLHARGGAESFVYEDVPEPRPGAGEVLIRVHAAGVTPTELSWSPTWTARTGEPRPLPIIPGHEFSGEIAAVGERASDSTAGDADIAPPAVGDLVFGLNDWFANGAQAEYCVARASEIAPKPRILDHVSAAVTPVSSLTAWQGLYDRGRLARGERVLIHGAAGGVGVFAVQLARRRGAHVIATASARNLDFVRRLGADEVIDYRAQRFEDVAGGVDLVFDAVGGETLQRSWKLLKSDGRLVTIATASEGEHDRRTREAFFIVEAKRRQLEEIARLIDAGELRPVLDAAFPLAEARRAYEHKPDRGKAALRVVDA